MSEVETYQPPAEPAKKRLPFIRYVMIAGGVVVGIIVLLFIISFVFAIANVQGAAEFFSIIRDVLIIVLMLQGILIAVALVVLVVQVANLVNLLQSEIKPALDNLQSTLNTVKGSAQFVSESVASPLVKFGGFTAGASVFIRELGGIRRVVRRQSRES
jgi:hypothetical protein